MNGLNKCLINIFTYIMSLTNASFDVFCYQAGSSRSMRVKHPWPRLRQAPSLLLFLRQEMPKENWLSTSTKLVESTLRRKGIPGENYLGYHAQIFLYSIKPAVRSSPRATQLRSQETFSRIPNQHQHPFNSLGRHRTSCQ